MIYMSIFRRIKIEVIMSDQPRLIHLSPDGPDAEGLTQLDLEPAEFQSPLPVQNAHIFYEDATIGLTVGVWDTTEMQETFGPYPGDEFICVLQGQFAMVDAQGDAVPAGKGDAVAFRNGAPMSWKQEGYLKKFFVTYLDPNGPVPQIATAQEAVIVLDPHAQLSDVSDSGQTRERTHVAFTNDAKNMTAGVWESGAADYGMSIFTVHKFVRVLEGEATILEHDGKVHYVTANDYFFIPKGTECQWEIQKYMKTTYAQIDAG
jgi:uncharacterized cupin superfamily protein